MNKPVKTNIRFKNYCPGQTMLLPPSLGDMIDDNHRISGLDQRGSQIGEPMSAGDLSAGRSRVAVMRPARPEGKKLVPDKK